MNKATANSTRVFIHVAELPRRDNEAGSAPGKAALWTGTRLVQRGQHEGPLELAHCFKQRQLWATLVSSRLGETCPWRRWIHRRVFISPLFLPSRMHTMLVR
jgi:hypothetical protein